VSIRGEERRGVEWQGKGGEERRVEEGRRGRKDGEVGWSGRALALGIA
jgi:hypothetical protein